jgi:Mrp family chromosome partitioning ATPase/capsular polysaccharide biosynthesis protein
MEAPARPSEPLDPRAYLRPIWTRRWIVLAIVVAVAGATYAWYSTRPKEYTAQAQVYVQASSLDQVLYGEVAYIDDQRNTQNQAALLKSRSVGEAVARRIGYRGDPGALLNAVTATPATSSDFVTITAKQHSARAAAALANAFAKAFIDLRSATARNKILSAREVAAAELARLSDDPANADARRTLKSRIRRLNVINSLPARNAELTSPALPPGAPSAPHPVRNAIFASLLALLFALGSVYLLELFDRRIKRLDDVESSYPYPILAVLPHQGRVAPVSSDGVAVPERLQEAFRSLYTSIELSMIDRPVRTILVASALPEEGKSTVVRNLALVYRAADRRVAVVESDLRRPSLAKLFGVERRPGLTDVLAGTGTTVDEALQPINAQVAAPVAPVDGFSVGGNGNANDSLDRGRLAVITSGPHPPNPPAVLRSQRVGSLLEELADEHDVVIIDSAPLLAVADAVPLLSMVDAVLLVTRLDLTTRGAARRVVDLIKMSPGANVAGVVVNDVSAGRLAETGFQYYYPGYSAERRKPARR